MVRIFYLPLAVMAWLAGAWIIEWWRARQLVIYGLFGSLICTVEDRLGARFHWWQYRDIGPFNTHSMISLLISLSAAPLFAMAFAQRLRPGATIPWWAIAQTTFAAMVPEIVAYHTQNIVYGRGWNLAISTVAYLPIWLGIWALHRWLESGSGVDMAR